jgi:hypothetical protein
MLDSSPKWTLFEGPESRVIPGAEFWSEWLSSNASESDIESTPSGTELEVKTLCSGTDITSEAARLIVE